jgi:hypothetical protein
LVVKVRAVWSIIDTKVTYNKIVNLLKSNSKLKWFLLQISRKLRKEGIDDRAIVSGLRLYHCRRRV